MGTDNLFWKKKRNAELKRKTGSRGKPKERFLIVCEGEKTEPEYFEAFPLNPQLLKVEVHGAGKNTLSLVEEAVEMKKAAQESDRAFDQVWCVFDKDSFKKQQVNQAYELAEKHKIKVAFSHEAFELWYLLHFDYIDAKLSRNEYKRMLRERFGHVYKKNDKGIYQTLLSRQTTAIKNAEKLLNTHQGKPPCERAPSTTVHQLVTELNQSLRR